MAFHIQLCVAVMIGLTAALAPARAEAPAAPLAMTLRAPVLDADAVPYLNAAGRADYQRFVQQATPRAFAVAPDGSWGWASALETQAATDARALEICNRWTGGSSTGSGGNGAGGGACKLYARNLDVVWPGRESTASVASETALESGPGWSLVPDARFFWQGPQRARGVYVWAHGRAAGGQDSRGSQPQPHVRVFNNAGYDVLRFDRAPETDETDTAAAWLHSALKALRAMGYQRVVVGGQSRGGWNALQALDQPGLVDAVVAIAPAAHGPTGSPAWAWALDDLKRIIAAARNPAARVVIANFARDEFDPDPEGRARIFRSLQAPQVHSTLFLDRPAGLEGHGGGADARFTLRYGACLLAFTEGRTDRCG